MDASTSKFNSSANGFAISNRLNGQNSHKSTNFASQSVPRPSQARSKASESSQRPPNHWTYPIGRAELTFYYFVWAAHSLASFFVAARLSGGTGRWLEHWMTASDYVSGYKMDNSDLEWKLYRETILDTILVFAIHSVVFHAAIRRLSPRFCSIFLVTFWIVLHVYMTSLKCVLFVGVHAALTTLLTLAVGHELVAWTSCVAFVLKVNDLAPFSLKPGTYYREFNLYLYTSVQVLNFCIHLIRNKQRAKLSLWKIFEYVEYLFYPMYSTSLIVLYDDFRDQMAALRANIKHGIPTVPGGLRCVIWQALRLIFWFHFLDGALHFCRVNAFFNSPFTMLNSLHNYELASVAYTAGQYFHVKYVVIFGVPRLFAQIDGMRPPGAPICISRVSKYSQMWRYFDQGLYQFLKKQVYIPLMGGSSNFSKLLWLNSLILLARKLCATFMVFFFVLLWHGLSSSYFYWVLLSGVELCVERLGRVISAHTIKFQERIGAPARTRLTAICMLATVVPGIFGVFFFLGKTGVGDHIFSRVLVNGLWDIVTLNVAFANAGFVLIHLFAIGYCFNHACLHLETVLSPHRHKLKAQ